ncbi:hypothetical protein AB4Y45_35055 [Paraburkholderia sp. EG287A]|uniref:hypothetical protein n=1 Tax=Paraburkholderia sp. EG287A TaxID=3237012 RepID=UPI0034D183B6
MQASIISCMDSPQGLSIFGPQGQFLRLLPNNPAIAACRDVVRGTMPAEQQWALLQDLIANPLKVLVDWCARFAIRFTDDGEFYRLQDRQLTKAGWLSLLQRCHATGGSPEPVLLLAERIGPSGKTADVNGTCIHLQRDLLRGDKVGIVKLVNLPAAAKAGDRVDTTSTGETPFLVSYDRFYLHDDGTLHPLTGFVLAAATEREVTEDVLAQPVILGNDQTYRCEEGCSTGWMQGFSFDSLKNAINDAKDIQKTGAQARIINRTSGAVVGWH